MTISQKITDSTGASYEIVNNNGEGNCGPYAFATGLIPHLQDPKNEKLLNIVIKAKNDLLKSNQHNFLNQFPTKVKQFFIKDNNTLSDDSLKKAISSFNPFDETKRHSNSNLLDIFNVLLRYLLIEQTKKNTEETIDDFNAALTANSSEKDQESLLDENNAKAETTVTENHFFDDFMSSFNDSAVNENLLGTVIEGKVSKIIDYSCSQPNLTEVDEKIRESNEFIYAYEQLRELLFKTGTESKVQVTQQDKKSEKETNSEREAGREQLINKFAKFGELYKNAIITRGSPERLKKAFCFQQLFAQENRGLLWQYFEEKFKCFQWLSADDLKALANIFDARLTVYARSVNVNQKTQKRITTWHMSPYSEGSIPICIYSDGDFSAWHNDNFGSKDGASGGHWQTKFSIVEADKWHKKAQSEQVEKNGQVPQVASQVLPIKKLDNPPSNKEPEKKKIPLWKIIGGITCILAAEAIVAASFLGLMPILVGVLGGTVALALTTVLPVVFLLSGIAFFKSALVIPLNPPATASSVVTINKGLSSTTDLKINPNIVSAALTVAGKEDDPVPPADSSNNEQSDPRPCQSPI